VIPTMLLAGLVVGALVHDDDSLRRSVALGVVASVLWGIIVGVGASSVTTALAGALLGMANTAVGALIGGAIRALCRSAHVRSNSSAT
jgi:hypothetical protein